jgi:endonuclease I
LRFWETLLPSIKNIFIRSKKGIRMKHCLSTVVYTTVFILVPFFAYAQTNPTAQSLPYSQDFGTAAFSTLPNGWAVWNGCPGNLVNRQDTAEIVTPTGNATCTTATAVQSAGGAYGYASGSDAMLYIQTSGNPTNGVDEPVLALNTLGVTQVQISYKMVMLVAHRVVGSVLQYRVGTSGTWTTITGTVYEHSDIDRIAGQADSFSVYLPTEAANQSVVQLRWAIWRGAITTTGNSSSSGIGFDSVRVVGTTGFVVNNPVSFKINLISDTKMNLTWQLPSGTYDSVLVFGRSGAPVDYAPSGWGKNYLNASDHWPSSGVYGNSRLLYNGTGASVEIDSLTQNTTYYFQAYIFKDTIFSSGTAPVFDTTAVQGTKNFTAISGNAQASISWTNYSGEQGIWWDEVLVLAKAGASVDALPAGDGTSYSANPVFGSGSELGTGNFVVYKGIGSIDTLTGLTNGTTYHLLAVVRNGSSWSLTSKIQRTSFVSGVIITVPPIPTLMTPTDGAANVALNPSLSWNTSTGAASYHLQVARDTAFATFTVDSSNFTGTTFSLSGLSAGTKYYWHVRATNTAGSSAYSPVYSFTTISQDTGGIAITYYQSVYKLYGTALRQALHDLIKGHTQISYDGLYNEYPITDAKPGNIVWDMYSDIPGGTPAYTFNYASNQKCGNYSGEGDCFNREHSWPQSWFNSASIPSSDLFNVYPTDGYVNNRRGNYNYATVGSASWTSSNGSKVGTCAYSGFSGTVFEPINTYKGDLARSNMYVSVRYYTEDASWSTSDGTNKSDLLTWYANQLYDWHIADGVSEKEINRNNAVYGIQHNRNPFIDHPEFAAEIWKTDMAPSIVSVTGITSSTIIIDFSRYVDSATSVTLSNFVIGGSLSPTAIQWGVNNDVSKIKITTSALPTGSTSLTIKNQKSINGIMMNDTTVSFIVNGTTATQPSPILPTTYSLGQNYPNPFNPVTVISYQVPATSHINLKVFDVLGREVVTLVNGQQSAGIHTVTFDASNLQSGVYLYRLQARSMTSANGAATNFIQTKKLLLLK